MFDWRAVGSALLGVAAVLIISGFGATSVGLKPYDSALMASWLQAIGSIGAIVGAFALSKYQATQQRKAVEQESQLRRKRVIEGYRMLLEHAVGEVKQIETSFRFNHVRGVSFRETAVLHCEQINTVLATLSQQPLQDLISKDAVFFHTLTISNLREFVATVLNFVQPGKQYRVHTDNENESFELELIRLRGNLDNMHRMLVDLVRSADEGLDIRATRS
ncbi:hypothetical protein [Burkholderia lata]|uniref:hypothetical protein n=1 Tax=Burkholderia lata (strain ATCC 17760 / DSM 23089 / LMG 22485 / NCIMB 9086 / R18194 / 383) TaxID=482957 RepID=UPI00145402B2|nr:hypothetical protein [Burkholderia lata]VWL95634.1 hypothetical protein BLA6992_01130 [Burkholderia lata]